MRRTNVILCFRSLRHRRRPAQRNFKTALLFLLLLSPFFSLFPVVVVSFRYLAFIPLEHATLPFSRFFRRRCLWLSCLPPKVSPFLGTPPFPLLPVPFFLRRRRRDSRWQTVNLGMKLSFCSRHALLPPAYPPLEFSRASGEPKQILGDVLNRPTACRALVLSACARDHNFF